MGQPHPVTLSGGLVHFQTNMDGLMQITGSGNTTVCGKNLFNEVYPNISTLRYLPVYVGNTTVTMSTNMGAYGNACNLFLLPGSVSSGASSSSNGVSASKSRTVAAVNGYVTIGYRNSMGDGAYDPRDYHVMLEVGSEVTAYEKYNGTTAAAGTARKSLVGINNVWSDSGNVTVTYWTH